jgi:hypothetical protein
MIMSATCGPEPLRNFTPAGRRWCQSRTRRRASLPPRALDVDEGRPIAYVGRHVELALEAALGDQPRNRTTAGGALRTSSGLSPWRRRSSCLVSSAGTVLTWSSCGPSSARTRRLAHPAAGGAAGRRRHAGRNGTGQRPDIKRAALDCVLAAAQDSAGDAAPRAAIGGVDSARPRAERCSIGRPPVRPCEHAR